MFTLGRIACLAALLWGSTCPAATLYVLQGRGNSSLGAAFIQASPANDTSISSGGSLIFCNLNPNCSLVFNDFTPDTTSLTAGNVTYISYFSTGAFSATGIHLDKYPGFDLTTISLPGYTAGSYLYLLKSTTDRGTGAAFIRAAAADDTTLASGGSQLFCTLAAECSLTLNVFGNDSLALSPFSVLSTGSLLGSYFDGFAAGSFARTGIHQDDALGAAAPFDLATIALPNSFAAVPEPANWALMVLGAGAIGMALRRRGPIGWYRRSLSGSGVVPA